MIYVSKCSNCNNEITIKDNITCVFYKCKMYCWKCRTKLISIWYTELKADKKEWKLITKKLKGVKCTLNIQK